MLHTLTLNPTLDLTYLVPEFKVDDTNRAGRVYRDPGGSGINVSRVAVRLGHPTVALGFMGGHTGLEVAELLEAEHVRTWMVPIPGRPAPTRLFRMPLASSSGSRLRAQPCCTFMSKPCSDPSLPCGPPTGWWCRVPARRRAR